MNLKELLGDLYTPEIEAKLQGKKMVDLSTGGYVSVDKYNAEVLAKQQLEAQKSALDVELNKKNESQLSDAEKMQQLIKDTAEAKANLIKERNKLEAEKVLSKAGLEESDYSNYIDKIITEDVEVTKSIAQSIVDTINKQKTKAEQDLRTELEKTNTLPPAGNPHKEMSLDDFNKLNYEEMLNLMQTQPEVYKKFAG